MRVDLVGLFPDGTEDFDHRETKDIKVKYVGDWLYLKRGGHLMLAKVADANTLFYWMSTHNLEKFSHDDVFGKAESLPDGSKVLLGGLGLNYDGLVLKEMDNIAEIDVVEVDADLIALVGPVVANDKTTIIHDGIKHYLETTDKTYDLIWFDIFPCDPNQVPGWTKQLTDLALPKVPSADRVMFWKQWEIGELA